MDRVENSEQENGFDSTPLTPDQKLSFHKSGHRAASDSSHGASSDRTLKEGSGSSSSSSSDSESESFNSSGNAYFSLPMNTDHKVMHQKILGMGAELPNFEEKLGMEGEEDRHPVSNAVENGDYEELVGKITKYEEELRLSKLKLQLSEDEVAKLRIELERHESFVALAGTLQSQLESAQGEIKMKETALEMERKRVMELQQEAELANELQEKLHLAQEEVAELKTKLDLESREVLDLQAKVMCYEADISDRDNELSELKDVLNRVQEIHSVEKAQMQSDLCSLSEKQEALEARLREWELECISLEGKLRQCEADKMELISVFDAKEIGLQGEISQLRKSVTDKDGHVEDLNKSFDNLKFKYDMLMAEKDGLNAKVDTLIADMGSRDGQVRQMEEHLGRLHSEHLELVARSESANKLIDDLRCKVAELEKEVDRQRVELSAGAEEKREAIRQLCFSLEHYRSGYKELRQAFLGHRRPAVMAS